MDRRGDEQIETIRRLRAAEKRRRNLGNQQFRIGDVVQCLVEIYSVAPGRVWMLDGFDNSLIRIETVPDIHAANWRIESSLPANHFCLWSRDGNRVSRHDQSIHEARNLALNNNCHFDWTGKVWELTHSSLYLDPLDYAPWTWTPEQVAADAKNLHDIYVRDFLPNDPRADTSDDATWRERWFPFVVSLPEVEQTWTRVVAMEDWCKSTIGPNGYRFISGKIEFRFRRETDAVVFKMIINDFFGGGPLDPHGER